MSKNLDALKLMVQNLKKTYFNEKAKLENDIDGLTDSDKAYLSPMEEMIKHIESGIKSIEAKAGGENKAKDITPKKQKTKATIIQTQPSGDDVLMLLGKGKIHGIEKGWKVVNGSHTGKIIKVFPNRSKAIFYNIETKAFGGKKTVVIEPKKISAPKNKKSADSLPLIYQSIKFNNKGQVEVDLTIESADKDENKTLLLSEELIYYQISISFLTNRIRIDKTTISTLTNKLVSFNGFKGSVEKAYPTALYATFYVLEEDKQKLLKPGEATLYLKKPHINGKRVLMTAWKAKREIEIAAKAAADKLAKELSDKKAAAYKIAKDKKDKEIEKQANKNFKNSEKGKYDKETRNDEQPKPKKF
jgi:hypothetical protein